MDHGKDLPPLTLSNTSVSCLVTLIPVLVSMTSHGDIPSYEDETDKPAWWPSDIQWRNPKFYVQDADKKDDGLKVLRKLVYSCYSYHGVEDLLCRLEETPVSDSETESGENMEIIQLAEESDEPLDDSSAESEGPVFVCCFCLDQFNSHELVNAHQNTCSKRFSETSNGSRNVTPTDKSKTNSVTRHIDAKDCLVESFLGPTECPLDISSDFFNVISASSSSTLLHIPPSKASPDKCGMTSVPQTSAFSNHLSRSSHISTPLSSATTTTAQKRPATTTTVPFVPTLKTRSQKKLDQIMEKHNSRRLMLKECHEMKDVPKTGAWWNRKMRRKGSLADQFPNSAISQNTYMLALGLAQTTDMAAMAKRGPKHEQEVDLECEITSVEGPLSLIPAALSPKVVEKPLSTSPRSTRSLMSQLSRDNEVNTRRKLSFCFVEDEWADKQAINEGRDPLQISLLTLEFSSPLGQRVKKYVRGEGHLNIIKDVESYCKTELDEDGYSKLRYRGCDFRITFRKKRRASNHVHAYKFNRFDRMEFKKLLKTGLSAYSRHLMKCLPVCKVVLNRLSESEIKLWTQEKKITISEQIIFDDDICITQIDIPESKMAQGFAPDIHSQSQHHLYRQTPPYGPSSPLSTARLNMTSDTRQLFSPRMPASPPHVPNIFRSRTSHTSSPPRPAHVSRPHNVPSSWKLQQLPDKVRKITEEQECSRFSNSYNVRDDNSQNKIIDRCSQNPAHLSGHVSLSPSAYSFPDVSVVEPKSNGEISNASNRRKQQLTHVRNDDGEGCGTHNDTTTNRIYISAGHTSSNSYRKGPVENHHSGTMQKNHGLTSPASSGPALGPSMRRLSNFDYFSIRDGKIQPSYPQHSHAVVSQHRTNLSSAPAAHSHNHQNLGPLRQDSHQPGHNHHCPPSSSVASRPRHNHHHPQHSSYSQPTSGQVRPSAILDYSSSKQHNSLSTNGTQDRSLSGNHHETNRPQTVKKMNAKAPSLHQNRFSEDDDVMEIICIDDD